MIGGSITDEPHLSETCVWYGFTFLSGSCEAELDLAVQAGLAAPEQMGPASKTWFSLSQTNVGDRVRITKLQRSNAGAELANAGVKVKSHKLMKSKNMTNRSDWRLAVVMEKG